MSKGQINDVLECLRRSAALERVGAFTDGELLRCYVAQRDEAAFETLVQRHGPMVLGVCRRLLANRQDAEDAFQATFLVLARKARSIEKSGSIGSWLYKVASRVALRARASARRRA